MRENTLFYGDNLDVLRQHIPDESIDLVYLDPPFQSGKDYNIIFRTSAGTSPAAQVKAFADTWKWSSDSERLYREVVEKGGALADRLMGLRQFLKETDVMAYLAMMAPRLLELRRVLKATGSIYLHCDASSSHYLKLLMDGVFGPQCFRNEIIWRYRRWPTNAKRFQRMHDVLLFYTKAGGKEYTFNQLYDELAESTVKTWGTKKQTAVFEDGRRLRSSIGESESSGAKMSDVWHIKIIPP
ncbi:MAG: DNA methyltransferase, partial [Deltaproteobacteria bacterium]